MATSPNRRTYRIQDLKKHTGDDIRLWICEDCGSLIGPKRQHRDQHDLWHAQVEGPSS